MAGVDRRREAGSLTYGRGGVDRRREAGSLTYGWLAGWLKAFPALAAQVDTPCP